VLALTGVTRFEAVTPDVNGKCESEIGWADLALEPKWFPTGQKPRRERPFPGSPYVLLVRSVRAASKKNAVAVQLVEYPRHLPRLRL
jgi:hypothetical protein